MITEILAKLDESKRTSVVVLMILVMACVCYLGITRTFMVKLNNAETQQLGLQAAYANTQQRLTATPGLQKNFDRIKQQLDSQKTKCFTAGQASDFFENINTMAMSHDLKPISRVISEPEYTPADKNNQTSPQFLATQLTRISVDGAYFDIVEFIEELIDRPQKVYITDLRIALMPGQSTKPRASFNIIVLTDTSQNAEE